MIEDKESTINNLSTIMSVICFNAKYNQNCNSDNIYRVNDWNEVKEIIDSIKEAKKRTII